MIRRLEDVYVETEGRRRDIGTDNAAHIGSQKTSSHEHSGVIKLKIFAIRMAQRRTSANRSVIVSGTPVSHLL
jgi:hypothetical protein